MGETGGSFSPRKPWEGALSSTVSPSPFAPASQSSNMAEVVESAGLAYYTDKNAVINLQNGAVVGRPPMPIRSYDSAVYPTNYNQYNSGAYPMNASYGNYNSYNRGYGVGVGAGMYGGGYGAGSSYYGMNGSNYGGSYAMGMPGPPQITCGDPNNVVEGRWPPSFWMSSLQKMHGMMVVLGNIVSLLNENTHSFHVLMTAFYTFLDRSGLLAGFVLKLLRMWSRPRVSKASSLARNTPKLQVEGHKSRGGGTWESVWSSGD